MFTRTNFASRATSGIAAVLCSMMALGIANAPAQFADSGAPAAVQTYI